MRAACVLYRLAHVAVVIDGLQVRVCIDLRISPSERASFCLGDDVIDFGCDRRPFFSLAVPALAEAAVTLEDALALPVAGCAVSALVLAIAAPRHCVPADAASSSAVSIDASTYPHSIACLMRCSML